ncbi:MAG: rRNA maturation RNase YbeY [Nostocaceae cyanobacterium]|nr:rRNA maturation RNase YbeY [Nostocaceae cyanobacterium]
MQVELYVQDDHQELIEDSDARISPQAWGDWFHRWLQILESELPPALSYEIGLRLTDDAEIQALNHQYRHQNQPTDVLTFAALEVNCPQSPEMSASMPLYLGDIVISVPRAKHQAQEMGHSLSTELKWLAAHALLHLLGWDHPDEESLVRMLNKQVNLLQSIGVNINVA